MTKNPGAMVCGLLCSMIVSIGSAADFQHMVPAQKNLPQAWKDSLYAAGSKTVYRGEQLETIGMPCGGICAGQLYVRGDGTLARWWIANNAYNTGYGIDHFTEFDTALGPIKVCYKGERPPSFIDQGFAVTVKSDDGAVRKTLSRADFDGISFVGEYPIAMIRYEDSDGFPLQVSSEIFSPFVPLNAKDSAIPGTILNHTLTNRTNRTVTVEFDGRLQNLVCLELKGQVEAQSVNRVVESRRATAIDFGLKRAIREKTEYVAFEKFDGDDYGDWSVEGEAFGKAPVRRTLPKQQTVTGCEGGYVNTFLDMDKSTGKLTSKEFEVAKGFIVFKIGGGNHPNACCINLIVDGEKVYSTTGENSEELVYKYWDVREHRGKRARIEIVDSATGGWGHVNIDDILFGDDPSIVTGEFDESHAYYGNVRLTVLDPDAEGTADARSDVAEQSVPLGEKLVASLSSSFTLKPGQSRTVTYLLTWYFPNRPAQHNSTWSWTKPISVTGPKIGNMYANWFDSSSDVADYLQKNLESLSDQTRLFVDTYYNQQNLPYWLLHRLMMPVSNLASETCQWWKNDRFWAWEGVGSCYGTCTHVWTYEHALARLFPELERNVREKQDFGKSFNPKTGGIATRDGSGGDHLDGHAGAILKAYREHLMTADNAFLDRNWAKIKKGMGYLIALDENDDGLIEGTQPNTYDISFHGANTYVGGLYLAALKACAEMADLAGDEPFAARCRSIAKRGAAKSVEKLWNGEYFVQDTTRQAHPKHQYWDGCLADQMFGQTWAHQLQLGYIYPADKVRSALRSIWKYNWTTDVGPQNAVHHPERFYASPGEPGLFICTWPKSEHPGNNGVRYRNEVWTGIEYQVAANMISEGMLDEGLCLIKAVHDRYVPEKHNPWNEVECGDHYARALASWGCLIALQDFDYDGPVGRLGFSPRLQPDDSRTFFTVAEGWGIISQKRTDKKQTNAIHVMHGRVRLSRLRFDVGEGKDVRSVKVKLGRRTLRATYTCDSGAVVIDLKKPCVVKADKKISVVLSY